jgi:glucose/mannose-6-phosphate isomerase
MINQMELKKIDSQNMFEILKNFPQQLEDAIRIGKEAPGFPLEIKSNDFAILGMGGSAIGGDLIRSYSNVLPGASHLSISVNRNYVLPDSIIERTNIIASSYSGGTEETITAYKAAIKKSKNVVCITTGGELEYLAIQNNTPVIKIPAGYQPRCALGYSFFTMLYLFIKSGAYKKEAIEITEKAIDELFILIKNSSEKFSNLSEDNEAYQTAKQLHGTIPVIYSSIERMDAVNLRWRGQIQENAKNLAFGNYLPEMNHNEINAFSYPENLSTKFSIIFMKDVDDNDRVKIRFNVLEDILSPKVNQIIKIQSDGKYLLTRLFDIIYFGDWVSYYLAILNGVDPTPIPNIIKLKKILSDKIYSSSIG